MFIPNKETYISNVDACDLLRGMVDWLIEEPDLVVVRAFSISKALGEPEDPGPLKLDQSVIDSLAVEFQQEILQGFQASHKDSNGSMAASFNRFP